MQTNAYACINNDEVVRLNSSSGGVYRLIAEYTLKHGGVVYASAYDDELNVRYIQIKDIKDIAKTQGAKYVFSNMGNSINEMADLLKKGIMVMFVGTPCQCSAIMQVLSDYRDRLVCVDFVCHGVPDVKVWNIYKESMKRRNLELVKVNMRAKDTGWSGYNYCWKFLTKSGDEIVQRQSENEYMRGFAKDLYLRNACYNCRYKSFERSSDITLGDFWGIWKFRPEMDDNKGTSLVLVHTELGKKIFESLKEKMTYKEVTKEEATRYNPSVIKVTEKPLQYDMFWEKIESEDFIDVINEMAKKDIKNSVMDKIRQIVKKLL